MSKEKLTVEQMAVAVLRALHDEIYSRETDVLADEALPYFSDESKSFDELMNAIPSDAPTQKAKGIVWHDGEDPIIAFSGDAGRGSVTIHKGIFKDPFQKHTHAGSMGSTGSDDGDFAAFVHGLYRHFQGEGLSWGLPIVGTDPDGRLVVDPEKPV